VLPPSAARPATHRKPATVSTESIASTPHSVGAAEPCARCGAPLAEDQRYCLECGERRMPMSSVLLGGPPSQDAARPEAAVRPPSGSGAPPAGNAGRGNAVTVIAGVGVLLLAMGVGVLIGRAGGSKQSAAPAQVISVGSTPSGSTPSGAAEGSSFTDDWPAGTSGYTVQLQALPQASTQVSAVQAAKSSASAKGAKGVGALKSEDFGLPAGNFVIYSGVYHKKAEADKALTGLQKSFPGASVVKVTSGASKASGGGAAGAGSTPSSSAPPSSSLSHPAPPTAVEKLKSKSGKSYEEESKNLPNVVETG
jgi:hypothetical protein